MAWMKSTSGASKDQWYLTGEFTVDRIGKDRTAAEGITAVLGFRSEEVTHEQVAAEIARVQARRAALIRDIVAAIPAPDTSGASAAEVAVAVKAGLADEFDDLRADVNKPRTLS